MHELTHDEYLLILRMQEKISKAKILGILNEGRRLTGESLLPKNFTLRIQIRPIDGYDDWHPLEAVLHTKWSPSKTYPISVDYIRAYGTDYLIGFLDGYENLPFGQSVGERSESYVRAYVDGYKALLRKNHYRSRSKLPVA